MWSSREQRNSEGRRSSNGLRVRQDGQRYDGRSVKSGSEIRRSRMGYYSVALDMTGRFTVVIGGGTVAERKVKGLLEAGAAVTVISPSLTAQLARWVKQGRISHVARSYTPGDLAGYELAFVATDDPRVNAAVFRESKKRGLWVNAADDPAHCDFILPSVLRRGELAVAVSTGGSSPALARA